MYVAELCLLVECGSIFLSYFFNVVVLSREEHTKMSNYLDRWLIAQVVK